VKQEERLEVIVGKSFVGALMLQNVGTKILKYSGASWRPVTTFFSTSHAVAL